MTVATPTGPPTPTDANGATGPRTRSEPGPAADGSGDSTRPPGRAVRELLARRRWLLGVAAVVVVALALIALTVPTSDDDRRLSPANPEPDGSRALARVLAQQGVEVVHANRSQAATKATTTTSTLVVTDTSLLSAQQLNRLAADDAARLVLVEPDEAALSVLAPQLRTAGYSNRTGAREPGCSVTAATTAGDVRGGGYLYARSGSLTGSSVAVCYPQSDSDETSDVDTDTDRGTYLVTVSGNRQVIVIGQSDLLTNQYLTGEGNAALALNTLGALPNLVWYTPDPLEPVAAGQRQVLSDLVPAWLPWSLAQLVLVVLVVMAWRARRFGRLVGEPLPVVVRAAETEEGRARLYRQFRARGRAAATLRTGALRRLATRLAVPPATTPEQLVGLVAAATGREPAAVARTLLGPPPRSDGELVELADRLDELERAAGLPPAGSTRTP